MGNCPHRAVVEPVGPVPVARRTPEEAWAAWEALVQGAERAAVGGVQGAERARRKWRKFVCKLRWLVRTRRLWGVLGNHLKLYKTLR